MDQSNFAITLDLPKEATLQLATTNLVQEWKNFQDRIIWLDGDIESECVAPVVDMIREFDKEPEKPIYVLIDSHGGDVAAGLALYDAISGALSPTYTINISNAASMGMIILLAGSRRFCYPHSTCVIHEGSIQMNADFRQSRSASQAWENQVIELKNIITLKSNIDIVTLENKLEILSDWHLSAAQQVEFGLVEKIIKSFQEI